MRRRLVTTYVAIAVIVLVLLEVPLAFTLAAREYDRLTNDVVGDAVVLAALAEEPLEEGAPLVLPDSVRSYAAQSGGRIVVLDAGGISIADTGDEVPRDFSTRPEVVEALAGARATGRRPSETLGEELLYVAVPVVHDGGVLGVVRITYPTDVARTRIVQQWGALVGVAAVVLTFTVVVALRLATWALRPVGRIADAVGRFRAGDLAARVGPTEGPAEVVQLAAEIDVMAAQLDALVSAQRGFAADASHQLRTPLTGVRLELENLQLAATDAATRAGLERAIDGTRRLSRMVDGLLTLARLDAERPQLEELDAAALVRAAADRWRPLAEESGTTLVVTGTDAPLPARGVPGHLDQVLDVLLDNALAASPPDGAVTITAEALGTEVRVAVEDQGPGMSPAERERAFERLWQGEARTGGTGLGLAIARRLADASGAGIALEAAPSGGLRAVVTLPGA